MLVAVSIVYAVTAGSARPADAATTTRVNLPVPERALPSGANVELVALSPIVLAPGETRFLEGRLAARSTTTVNVEERLAVGCLGNAGEQVSASRNHEGTDFPQTGDSYVRDASGRPVLTLIAHFLFTAPPDAAGTAAYTCRMSGGAGDQDAGHGLIAVRSVRSPSGAELAATWLQVSNENGHGAHWVDMGSTGTQESNCEPKDLYRRCQPKPCPSGDTGPVASCQYVVPNGNPNGERILETKVAKSDLLPGWNPGGTATVYADFELTSCFSKSDGTLSASCHASVKPQARRCCIESHVLFRLEVSEIDATGTPANCRGPDDPAGSPGWSFSPRPGAGDQGGDYQRETLRDEAHHQKLYRFLERRLSSNPACTRLLVRVFVRAGDGQPIKVDTNRLSSAGLVRTAFTNGAMWMTGTSLTQQTGRVSNRLAGRSA